MRHHPSSTVRPFVLAFFLLCAATVSAQQITGVWRGRMDGRKVELKIIQKGDSLAGTAYYYESAQRFSQYSIKGYFDSETNSVVWWDDVLLQEKGKSLFRNPTALLTEADFNCPGGGRMYLQGKAKHKEEPEDRSGVVDITKGEVPLFPDAWDYVIANYTMGTNDPYIIDSIAMVAFTPPAPPMPTEAPVVKTPIPEPVPEKAQTTPPPNAPVALTPPLTIEEKFKARKKVFTTEIPVAGDSIELRFYDNAEVDGDSISLFFNNQLLFQHIRLTEKAYTVKLPATAFADTAELVMVAENLGSIPPNTSYMVAESGGQRYEARLASTEWSRAYIRLRKPKP